jgi:hypothetical protein
LYVLKLLKVVIKLMHDTDTRERAKLTFLDQASEIRTTQENCDDGGNVSTKSAWIQVKSKRILK